MTPSRFIFALLMVTGAALGQLQAQESQQSPQQPASQQPLNIDEIKVVAPYEPTISDAFKINDHPRIDDTLAVNMDFDYSIFPRRIDTRFEVEPLAPARMRGEPLSKLYRGLVRAGYGTYSSPYLEAFYNTLRSDRYALGMHLKHFSSTGQIKEHEYSAFSDNKAAVYGKRFFRNHTLDASVGFQRDVIHYYGFTEENFADNPALLDYIDALEKEDIRQHFNHLSANIGFGTHHLDSTKTLYSTGLSYHWLADRYDAAEHNLQFTGNIGRQLPQDPLGFGITHYFDLDASADYYNTLTPLDTSSAALVSVKPRILSSTGNLRFHVGLDVSVQGDTTSYLRAYPLAGAQVDIVPGVFTAFAHFAGRLEKHSLRSFSEENPFINTAMNYGFMNVKSEIGGGIRGSLTDYVSYSLSFTNANIDQFPLFVTDTATTLNNQFTVVYDNVKRFNPRAEIFSQVSERFSTRIRADLYEYNLDQQAEAWHLPSIELSLNLKYNIQDKLILTADAFARDSVFALVYDELDNPMAQEIHGFHVDFNFGVEYRYTRIFGIFLNFNNLQNQSRERWLNYPSQRLNIIGGLSYSF